MNQFSNPILFPLESPLGQSAGLKIAASIAAIYKIPLKIVFFIKADIQPEIPIRKNGVIVSVNPKTSEAPDNAREKLDSICRDLKAQFPHMQDCSAIIRTGFIENEFEKIVKEAQPFWTVWSNSQDRSNLKSVIYNLSEGRGRLDAFPLLITSESAENLFPPSTIQFYTSKLKTDSEMLAFIFEMAEVFKANVQLYEVIEKVTPQDYQQAEMIESNLKVRFSENRFNLTKISGEDFHLQIFSDHSGNQDLIVLNHMDRILLEMEFEGVSSRSQLEASQNPIMII